MLNVKLITIILFTTLLSSCRYETPQMPFIVTEIESNGSQCKYISYKSWSGRNPFGHWSAAIIDDCEKFNIGDTIKLTK